MIKKIMGIEFVWDKNKNISNQQKHGLSFEVAKLVFDDPLSITIKDRTENGEQRWRTIGMAINIAYVLVIHTITETDTDTIIRIISARKADKQERKFYEQ